MGLFDFLFSSGVSNSQKKAHRNAGNNTSSDMKIMLVVMKMVMMTVAATMIVLTKTITIVVIAIVMSMKVVRMMNAMTIIAVGSHLHQQDYQNKT